MDHVYGFAVGCDLTRRDLQFIAKKMGRPWCASKGFDGSAPCGPIVPLDEVHIDATSVLSLGVNGSSRQQSKIGNMIWTIPEVVSYLSKYFRLMQGDLIFTGTPAGVGDLNIGDDVSVACANLPGCKFVIGPPEK